MPRSAILGNHRLTLTFDAAMRRRDVFYPAAGLENHTLGRPGHLGVRCGGRTEWLDETWSRVTTRTGSGLSFELRPPHAPVTIVVRRAIDPDHDVFAEELTVRTESLDDLPVEIFEHQDFSILESDIGNSTAYDPVTGGILHWKRNRWFLLTLAGEGVPSFTIARNDDHLGRGARAEADRGALARNPVAMGAGESILSLSHVVRADREWRIDYRMIGAATRDLARATARLTADVRTVFERFARRENVLRDATPEGVRALGPDFVDLWTASRSVILAHQSQNGAIVAALDGDILDTARDSYGYVWPRDLALIADALDRAGDTEAAMRALTFAADRIEPEGYLEQRFQADGTRGSTWHPLVRAEEERPPIQEDETALVVWALTEIAERRGDRTVGEAIWREFILPATDFLESFREKDSGMPKPSYDPWEERHGIHLWTVCAVEAALRRAAAFAERRGVMDRAERWSAAARDIAQAREHYLFHLDEGRYARAAYVMDGGGYYLDMTPDASMAALILFDVHHAPAERVEKTLEDLERRLRVPHSGGLFARYLGDRYWRPAGLPDTHPGNPWLITTLWIARWKIRSGDPDLLTEALSALRSVAGRANAEGTLAEQYDALSGAPLSAAPLVWSHAEWITTLDHWLMAAAAADLPASRERRPPVEAPR